jgi:methanogenic corrinoid protein MtbC1
VTEDDLTAVRLGVMSALREGDAALAYRLILRLMEEGYSMPRIVDEVLAPIQQEAGRRWEVGDASISEEHVSTAAVETLVSMLAGMFDQPPDAEVVVVVCAEGDTHSLPARMASALLAYEGYRTLFLGTSVPASDLAEYLASVDADVLVVSCTRPVHLLGARACVVAGHGAGVPVVVGGRAFHTGRRWELIGADACAPRLSALAELVQTWQPDPVDAEQRATSMLSAVETVVAHREHLADSVTSAITEGGSLSDVHRRFVRDAVQELIDLLAVALQLDDAELLADEVTWLSGLLGHRAGLPLSSDQLLTCLEDVVAPLTPEIGTVIEAARDHAS